MTERYYTLGELASMLPPGRKSARIHPSTLTRWIQKGVRAPSGERVKLAGTRLGGRWLVDHSAWSDFQAALTPSTGAAPVKIETPGQRRRQRAAAQKMNAEFYGV